MKSIITERLRHSYILLYTFIYLIIFFYLEQNIKVTHIIEFQLDHYIPFIEIFIIPYLLWFAYVAVAVAYFLFFGNIGEYYRLICNLFLGMTVFLIVSAVFPNGLDLRPQTFARDNIFTDMVRVLYASDTSTNVVPSIHVYNSICVHIAVAKSSLLQKKKYIVTSSLILMILIILSTMFLKQHSILDVISGIVMAAAFYPLFYIKNLIPYRKEFPLETVPKTVAKRPSFHNVQN